MNAERCSAGTEHRSQTLTNVTDAVAEPIQVRDLLPRVADDLAVCAVGARIRGDDRQGDRLDRLAAIIAGEAEYVANIDRGYQIVRRRTDAPAGATVGWYRMYDAESNAARAAITGVSA